MFTSALGLVAPWEVDKVDLDTARRRIEFEVRCSAKLLACSHCGVADQHIHDRLRRSWRHLDFFQFDAWLRADVPRVACTGCGKTSQAGVPWAREGSGFTALFEALALALCRAHGGDPEQVRHVCQDMSAAYAKGGGMALPNAAISDDRFHVVAMAVDAMDKVRQAGLRDEPQAVAKALGTTERKTIEGLLWGMRKNPGGWTLMQTSAMHCCNIRA